MKLEELNVILGQFELYCNFLKIMHFKKNIDLNAIYRQNLDLTAIIRQITKKYNSFLVQLLYIDVVIMLCLNKAGVIKG